MNTIETIHDEHATMLAIYQAIGHVLDEIAAGALPDWRLLSMMLDYVIHEPEELHHPREDRLLFPLLMERDAACRALIEKLSAQHAEGHEQVGALAGAFIRFLSRGREGFAAFEEAARRYIAAAERHIMLEEHELLPLARKVLSAEDLDELDRRYRADGAQPASAFRELFKEVANRLPDPYGFGAARS